MKTNLLQTQLTEVDNLNRVHIYNNRAKLKVIIHDPSGSKKMNISMIRGYSTNTSGLRFHVEAN